MFYYDFLKGQVSERFSTISSFTDAYFLTGHLPHACSFHHIVTRTWIIEDRLADMSFHHLSTSLSSCFLFRQSPSQGLQTVTPNLFGIWEFKRELHGPPLTSPWHLSKLDAEQEWKSCRIEVTWLDTLGQKHPAWLWNREEAGGGDGFSGWGPEYASRLKEQRELLQPYIHGNRLWTNFIPCWGLLFLRRKWIKEVKVRKPRTENETSIADTYPLSAALLKIFLTANINGQCLTI